MTNTTITADQVRDRASASIYMLAVGDAWGEPTEFHSYRRLTTVTDSVSQELFAEHDIDAAAVLAGETEVPYGALNLMGPEFPERPLISDDTQNALAVWDAMTEAISPEGDFALDALGEAMAHRFAAWSTDRDNNRAPGNACMQACRKLSGLRVVQRGTKTVDYGKGPKTVPNWVTIAVEPAEWDAAGGDSMGCGSVMRAPWIGTHPHVSNNIHALQLIAQISAVVTHTHPGAIAAAEATAVLARHLATGTVVPGAASAWLHEYAHAGVERWVKHPSVVGRFVEHRGVSFEDDVREFAREGWSRIDAAALDATDLAARLHDDPWGFDPCDVTNNGEIWTQFMKGNSRRCEGWDAVSCLALAVGILDGFADSVRFTKDVSTMPLQMIRRAVVTNGDSDSIAATLGGLVGAAYGMAAVPMRYVMLMEDRYRDALTARAGYDPSYAAVPEPVFA